MKFLSRIITWLRHSGTRVPTKEVLPSKPQTSIVFPAVTFVAVTPPNDQVMAGQLYVVVHNETRYWTLFRCPSGCGDIISLSLRPEHNPSWSVRTDVKGRPTLYPSVWRNTGCLSHFWLESGRIIWCRNSGIAPSYARPDLYQPRSL